MKRRPAILVIFAFALTAIAVSLPVQIMWLYGHPLAEFSAVLAKLTSFNWMIMGLALSSAYFIFVASPKVRYTVPALVAIVAVNNFFVGYYATDFSPWTASFATLGFVVLNLPLMHPTVRPLFTNPKKRWWLRAERKRLSIPIYLGGNRRFAFRSETFDISESGAFVPLQGMGEKQQKQLQLEERLSICLTLGALQQVRCEARIVRRAADPAGRYPAGLGIEFVNMGWSEKRELKRYLAKHPEAQT